MNNLVIATYNVRGIRDTFKRRKIFNFLHDKGFDIVLMQETHSLATNLKYWRAEWGGNLYCVHGTSASRGVAICFRKGFSPKIHDVVRDVDGRYIIMKIEIESRTIAIDCLYAPNEDSPDFFVEFFRKIEAIKVDSVIIGGDFNTILWEDDIKGGRGHTHKNVLVICRGTWK